MKKLFVIVLLLLSWSVVPWSAHAAIFGPLFSGSPQTLPPSGTAPVVASKTCNINLPTVSQNVALVGGGTCQYTAKCASAACTGINAITGWAITAQSTANAFAITTAGILQGGSAAASVTTAAYTVTVTATNSTGTSPGVVQTVNAFAAPVVASLACSIKSPISNGSNVVLQAGGNCQYTVTCAGGACSGANAITSWAVTTQTCTNCYQVSSTGILQGGSGAATVTNRTDTVTITATNAGGTSPAVGQTVTAVTVPAITNRNFSVGFPMTVGQTIGTMVAAPTAASWAITAVSGGGTGATIGDFAISSSPSPGGVLTVASVTDITAPGTISISMTATNATGTSSTGTGTITLAAATNCPQGTALADGCTGAQTNGTIVDAHLADAHSVIDLNVTSGSGYTNGTYTWTSSGGACSPNASGTLTVSGGKLGGGATQGAEGSYTITAGGSGCTSRPTIAIPAGAGAGTGGNITPTVYQFTPHTAATPWNVPGVDYPVGYDTTLTLKNPRTQNPGCTTFDGNKTLTVNASNCTINGFDFTSPIWTLLVVPSGMTGVNITNNKFKCLSGSGQFGEITVNGTGVGVTIKYNTFDGSSVPGSFCLVAAGQADFAPIDIGATTGTVTVEYNYCFHGDLKCLNFRGAAGSPSTLTVVEKYNYWRDFGTCNSGCGGAHAEAEYSFTGTANSIITWTQQFNVMLLHFYNSPGAITSAQAMEADNVTLNSPDVEFNYVMARGNQSFTGNSNANGQPASAAMFCGAQGVGQYTGTPVMSNNVIDYTGGFFAVNPSGSNTTPCGTGNAFSGTVANRNAGTGNVCTISTCN